MGKLVQFDQGLRRPKEARHDSAAGAPVAGPGRIVIFTGIRYERQEPPPGAEGRALRSTGSDCQRG